MRIAAVLLLLAAGVSPAAAQHPRSIVSWPAPAAAARPWTRWWWMGDAVTAAGIDIELARLAAAGFGGVEITATYGARGAEAQSVPYLSPQWVKLLAHASRTARRLGMRVDLPPGSGWRMGGPDVPASESSRMLHVERDSASGAYIVDVRPSLERVKRPAPGGDGSAIDVYSRTSVAHYLAAFGARTRALPRSAVRAFFHDSFEYGGDASTELFAFFAERRGYDLATELPALAGEGEADRVARVKSDYRQTLDEMLLEHLVRPLTAWSHAHGSLLREQAHGSPANLLDLYAASDIPETESFGPVGGRDSDPLVQKFASSAAHLAGRRLASAEAFTWLGEHFSSSLDDVRRGADVLFLAGINHLVYHGSAYSPDSVAWPGWQFYASSEFNARNAWWPDLPALNAYVTRVQSVLQQGRAEADVLLYWPVWDSWHDPGGRRMDFRVHDPAWLRDMPVGAAARALSAAHASFDYVSDRQLSTLVHASRQGLSTPGADYRVLLVPPVAHMPPETLERLLALARDGATVLFLGERPGDVPGLGRLTERRARLARARAELPVVRAIGDAPVSRRLGLGRVVAGGSVTALLDSARVMAEPLARESGVRLLRRRRGDGYDYFIAASASLRCWVSLPFHARTVVLMDPMTGRTGLADVRTSGRGDTRIRLEMDSGETRIVRTTVSRVSADRWAYEKPVGPAIPLAGRWTVRFLRGGPVLPPPFMSDTLATWTGRGDDDADRFAGTARYALTFDAPSAGGDFLLDLGRVAESARVRLDGREVAALIAHPFRVRTGTLRARGNLLEVDVTNLSANRVRDLDRRGVAWKTFRDINYVGFDYRPFDASGWPVRQSGLRGPVTLTPLAPVAATDP